jgi:phosphate transport system protein
MLHRAMTAFLDGDEKSAQALISEDDVIDKWYLKLYNEAIESVLGDPSNLERANYVIWAAHNLERLGDRVTNICERFIYIVTGDHSLFDLVPAEAKLSLGEL